MAQTHSLSSLFPNPSCPSSPEPLTNSFTCFGQSIQLLSIINNYSTTLETTMITDQAMMAVPAAIEKKPPAVGGVLN